MKVIIAGGRDFRDKSFLYNNCDYYLKNTWPDLEIVSGGQVSTDEITGEKYGADYLGEQYANDRGLFIKRFSADWGLGKKAGPIRNKGMAEYADCLIAFWDGKSKGTKNMIEIATEMKLKIRVIKYQ